MSKKKIIIMSVIVSVIFIIIFSYRYVTKNIALNESNLEKECEEIIEVNIPKDSKVIKKEDTYGGFTGDGEYYEEIQLTKEGSISFVEDAKKSKVWNEFPINEEVNYLIYKITTKHINELLTQAYYKGFPDNIIREKKGFGI